MLDRTIAPVLQPFKHIPLPEYHSTVLSNGIPVYFLPWGNTGITEINLVFAAGRNHAAPSLANMAMAMLTEGTIALDSQAFAQALDDYGAYMGHEVENEYSTLGLTTLSSQMHATVPLLRDAAFSPRFAPELWEIQVRNTASKLAVEQKTTSYQARRTMAEKWFGPSHPLGKFLDPEEVKALSLEDARQFHNTFIKPETMQIVVCGEYDEASTLALLDTVFGQLPRQGTERPLSAALTQAPQTATGREQILVSGMQSTLRLVQPGVPRSHPDFYAIQFMGVVFGGYFGSRLMKNIREEKGYTYGISAMWAAEKNYGYLVIGADVGNEYVEDTIVQTKLEMKRLQEELASDEEIDLVRNYLIGTSISQRETPAQMADLLAFSLMSDLSFPELDRKFEVIAAMTAQQVQALARQWLRPDELLEVVAGA